MVNFALGQAMKVQRRIKIIYLYFIYLSTAIGLTPGGSGTVHTINA